ncbi:MAG: helix-turn-helix domain-containing protein, partial [Bacteroidales bacterium]
MKTEINKEAILQRVKTAKKFTKDFELANFFGIKTSTLSNWYARNSIDFELLFSKCEEFSPEWLLTGAGEMLRSAAPKETPTVCPTAGNEGIPLITTEAMAGYFTGDTQVLEYECEKFIVPTFKGAEFLIPIKGSSMQPKYNSGDIVACK